MNYRLKVTILNSEVLHENVDKISFEFDFLFIHEDRQQGNGYYVVIESKRFSRQIVDLRHDVSFDSNDKEQWLKSWAKSHWNGKNNSWYIDSLEIIKL